MSTLAAANRRYFDAISDTYDSKPWFAKVNAQLTSTLRSRLDWIGIPFANTNANTHSSTAAAAAADVNLLDYACGTGLMTRIFGPYVSVTRGIDISPAMVAKYNSRVEAAALSGEGRVHAVQGNLFDESDVVSAEKFSGREWCDFDIVTVGFGFHHFPDVVRSARWLKERLRPGGVLVISDFVEGGDVLADEEGEAVQGSEGNHAVHSHGHGHEHGGHDHAHEHHAHHHDGKEEKTHDVDESSLELEKKMAESVVVPHFSVQGVKNFFTEAGFVDVDVITMDERVYIIFAGKKLWRTILFARGRRPFESGEKSEL